MLVHVDLFVACMARSLDFYVGQLGLEVIEDRIVEGELVRHVSDGHHDRLRMVILKPSPLGSKVELLELEGRSRLTGAPSVLPPHRGSLTLLVRDLGARLTALRAAGIETSRSFRVDSAALGNAEVAFLRDPDGHSIELLQPLARSEPAGPRA
jgi:catechol 2,3-dioxygenase-like lactoylglutathione lyase family enzyme